MLLNLRVPIVQGLRFVPDQKPQHQIRLVVCPTCKGQSVYADSNPFRPFCSERCKNTDFGAWAGEGFRMPADVEPDEQTPGDMRLQ